MLAPGRVQILERDDDFSLNRVWAAFVRQASRDVVNSSKPLTNPQISLYDSCYGTLIPNAESGEGVVSSGTVVQTLDYYPFGDERIDNQYGSADEKRKFAGMERDDSTGLDYAKARYYDNTRGQFLSQDPVFWELGQSPDGRAVLADPQLQNSYSWARNNPITLKDPDGRNPLLVGGLIVGGVGFGGTYYSDIRENQRQGITGLAQFAPREGFVSRGAAATVSVGIGFFFENPVVSGVTAGGESLYGDYKSGRPFDYGGAARNAGIGFGSDLILSPLKDAPASLKRDIAQILGSGILNLGGQEFFRNTQPQQSQLQSRPQQYSSPQSSLPSTVTQNGNTYYRTKDGLLSDKPQK